MFDSRDGIKSFPSFFLYAESLGDDTWCPVLSSSTPAYSGNQLHILWCCLPPLISVCLPLSLTAVHFPQQFAAIQQG